jgi:hypothetical protein
MHWLLIVLMSLLLWTTSCDKNKPVDNNMDLTVKEVLNLDIPLSCKLMYVCWKGKAAEIKDKSACEKFAIPCAAKANEIDNTYVKLKVDEILRKIEEGKKIEESKKNEK